MAGVEEAVVPFLPHIIIAVLAIIVVYIGIKLGKQVILLVVNSFLGIIGLLAVNFFIPSVDIEIKLATILIAGLGGIPGIIILIILDALGIAV